MRTQIALTDQQFTQFLQNDAHRWSVSPDAFLVEIWSITDDFSPNVFAKFFPYLGEFSRTINEVKIV